MKKRIEEIRKRLNEAIEQGRDSEEILKLSRELDSQIEEYLSAQGKTEL